MRPISTTTVSVPGGEPEAPPYRRVAAAAGRTRPADGSLRSGMLGLLLAFVSAVPNWVFARQPVGTDILSPVRLEARLVEGSTATGHLVLEVRTTIARPLESALSLQVVLPAGVTWPAAAAELVTMPSNPGTYVTTFALACRPEVTQAQLYVKAATVALGAGHSALLLRQMAGATLLLGPQGAELPARPGVLKPERGPLAGGGSSGSAKTDGEYDLVLEMTGVTR